MGKAIATLVIVAELEGVGGSGAQGGVMRVEGGRYLRRGGRCRTWGVSSPGFPANRVTASPPPPLSAPWDSPLTACLLAAPHMPLLPQVTQDRDEAVSMTLLNSSLPLPSAGGGGSGSFRDPTASATLGSISSSGRPASAVAAAASGVGGGVSASASTAASAAAIKLERCEEVIKGLRSMVEAERKRTRQARAAHTAVLQQRTELQVGGGVVRWGATSE